MQILLFSHDPIYASAAVAAGVARVVVDWEWRGKAERQAGWNTQINGATVDDLRAMHATAGDRVICRINNSPDRVAECRLAIDNGHVVAVLAQEVGRRHAQQTRTQHHDVHGEDS